MIHFYIRIMKLQTLIYNLKDHSQFHDTVLSSSSSNELLLRLYSRILLTSLIKPREKGQYHVFILVLVLVLILILIPSSFYSKTINY